MPNGPQGQKRKADVIGNAVLGMKTATGGTAETATGPWLVALNSAFRISGNCEAYWEVRPPKLPKQDDIAALKEARETVRHYGEGAERKVDERAELAILWEDWADRILGPGRGLCLDMRRC